MQKQYLTVSALTKYVKMKLENDVHLQRILIKGEISNFKAHDRGHFYFTLKDEQTQISAMMFANYAQSISFKPKDGDHVLIEASMGLYEARGTYNLTVYKMSLDGVGELYLKYEALKKEFEARGYFDKVHKKSIPKFPQAIGVITSPTGAVIEDIKNTVSRRYLLTKIILYPTLVQGEGAKESIVKKIKQANKENLVDVIILGRGGGSIEDLWAFNERMVVEAIFESRIPVITAIGHETDFTLSDYVSDLRAPTPTAAAELATPNVAELYERLKEIKRLLDYYTKEKLKKETETLLYLDQRLDVSSPKNMLSQLTKDYNQQLYMLSRNYKEYLNHMRQTVNKAELKLISPKEKLFRLQDNYDNLVKRLSSGFAYRVVEKRYVFDKLTQQIKNLNPLSYMEKGFSLTSSGGHIVTSVHQISVGEALEVEFKDGKVKASITDKEVKQ